MLEGMSAVEGERSECEVRSTTGARGARCTLSLVFGGLQLLARGGSELYSSL